MAGRTLILGTRGSRLALAQAHQVRDWLPQGAELNVIRTSGDRQLDVALHEQQGVGFFTKEIEHELLGERIDLAVHSLKDLPIRLPEGLTLAAIPPREVVADVLLVRPEAVDRDAPRLPLRPGATVATSALRRQSLLRSLRPDLVPVGIRGNVPTRIEKIVRGEADATLLAHAGLRRLGLDGAPLVCFELNPALWVPAPGQAALGLEVRAADTEAMAQVRVLDHLESRSAVDAERGLLLASGGGCHSAFAAWARPEPGGFVVTVAMPHGSGEFRRGRFASSSLDEAEAAARAWVLAGAPNDAGWAQEGWDCRPLTR